MEKNAIFVDTRDELKQQRFFPFGMESHCQKKRSNGLFYYDPWYYSNLYYDVPQGNLDCCSTNFVLQTSVSPSEQYLLDYFVYNVAPFGISTDRNFNEILPRKFTLEEIEKAAHEKSFHES